jgi:hypothetical protein
MFHKKFFDLDFFTYIEDLNEKIIQMTNNFNMNKQLKNDYWKIKKYEWQKNRLIFYYFFKKKNCSKSLFQNLKKKIDFDHNLINSWRKIKFENLCSTEILYFNSLCRKPFSKRESFSKFLIQEKSGCICCITCNDFEFPIWWDQFSKIYKFYEELKIKKFFTFLNTLNSCLKKLLKKNFCHNKFNFDFISSKNNIIKLKLLGFKIKADFFFWIYLKKKIKNKKIRKIFFKYIFFPKNFFFQVKKNPKE